MKVLLYLTLPGATLLSNVFVFGQVRKPGFDLCETQPGYIKPPMIFKLSPKHRNDVWIQGAGIDTVRLMAPDRMPCLVTDLSRMERMPVQRRRNPEPMPNGAGRKH